MVAKKYAISAPSAAIALRYGANVSKGIKGMNERIKLLESNIEAYSGPSVRKLK